MLRTHLDPLHFELFEIVRGFLPLHGVCLLFHLQGETCKSQVVPEHICLAG